MAIGIGEALRNARTSQDRSIDDAARDTRVRAGYLQALEDEDFAAFGGDVYAKGFLSTYARYLKIDPAPLLEQYRRYVQTDENDVSRIVTEPVARQVQRRLPPWIGWAVIALLALFAIGAVSNMIAGRVPETAEPPVEASSAPPTAVPLPSPRPTPSPTPVYVGVNLLLEFDGESWIRVEVDGQQVEETVVAAGETREYQGDAGVTIRFGNPGGVRVTFNGEAKGIAGDAGRPKTIEYNEAGPVGEGSS